MEELEHWICEIFDIFSYKPDYCISSPLSGGGGGGRRSRPPGPDSGGIDGGRSELCDREQCYPCSSPSDSTPECNGGTCLRKGDITNLQGVTICSACENQEYFCKCQSEDNSTINPPDPQLDSNTGYPMNFIGSSPQVCSGRTTTQDLDAMSRQCYMSLGEQRNKLRTTTDNSIFNLPDNSGPIRQTTGFSSKLKPDLNYEPGPSPNRIKNPTPTGNYNYTDFTDARDNILQFNCNTETYLFQENPNLHEIFENKYCKRGDLNHYSYLLNNQLQGQPTSGIDLNITDTYPSSPTFKIPFTYDKINMPEPNNSTGLYQNIFPYTKDLEDQILDAVVGADRNSNERIVYDRSKNISSPPVCTENGVKLPFKKTTACISYADASLPPEEYLKSQGYQFKAKEEGNPEAGKYEYSNLVEIIGASPIRTTGNLDDILECYGPNYIKTGDIGFTCQGGSSNFTLTGCRHTTCKDFYDHYDFTGPLVTNAVLDTQCTKDSTSENINGLQMCDGISPGMDGICTIQHIAESNCRSSPYRKYFEETMGCDFDMASPNLYIVQDQVLGDDGIQGNTTCCVAKGFNSFYDDSLPSPAPVMQSIPLGDQICSFQDDNNCLSSPDYRPHGWTRSIGTIKEAQFPDFTGLYGSDLGGYLDKLVPYRSKLQIGRLWTADTNAPLLLDDFYKQLDKYYKEGDESGWINIMRGNSADGTPAKYSSETLNTALLTFEGTLNKPEIKRKYLFNPELQQTDLDNIKKGKVTIANNRPLNSVATCKNHVIDSINKSLRPIVELNNAQGDDIIQAIKVQGQTLCGEDKLILLNKKLSPSPSFIPPLLGDGGTSIAYRELYITEDGWKNQCCYDPNNATVTINQDDSGSLELHETCLNTGFNIASSPERERLDSLLLDLNVKYDFYNPEGSTDPEIFSGRDPATGEQERCVTTHPGYQCNHGIGYEFTDKNTINLEPCNHRCILKLEEETMMHNFYPKISGEDSDTSDDILSLFNTAGSPEGPYEYGDFVDIFNINTYLVGSPGDPNTSDGDHENLCQEGADTGCRFNYTSSQCDEHPLKCINHSTDPANDKGFCAPIDGKFEYIGHYNELVQQIRQPTGTGDQDQEKTTNFEGPTIECEAGEVTSVGCNVRYYYSDSNIVKTQFKDSDSLNETNSFEDCSNYIKYKDKNEDPKFFNELSSPGIQSSDISTICTNKENVLFTGLKPTVEQKYCELGYYPNNSQGNLPTNHCGNLDESQCYAAPDCHYQDGECYKYEQATCVQIPQPGRYLSENYGGLSYVSDLHQFNQTLGSPPIETKNCPHDSNYRIDDDAEPTSDDFHSIYRTYTITSPSRITSSPQIYQNNTISDLMHCDSDNNLFTDGVINPEVYQNNNNNPGNPDIISPPNCPPQGGRASPPCIHFKVATEDLYDLTFTEGPQNTSRNFVKEGLNIDSNIICNFGSILQLGSGSDSELDLVCSPCAQLVNSHSTDPKVINLCGYETQDLETKSSPELQSMLQGNHDGSEYKQKLKFNNEFQTNESISLCNEGYTYIPSPSTNDQIHGSGVCSENECTIPPNKTLGIVQGVSSSPIMYGGEQILTQNPINPGSPISFSAISPDDIVTNSGPDKGYYLDKPFKTDQQYYCSGNPFVLNNACNRLHENSIEANTDYLIYPTRDSSNLKLQNIKSSPEQFSWPDNSPPPCSQPINIDPTSYFSTSDDCINYTDMADPPGNPFVFIDSSVYGDTIMPGSNISEFINEGKHYGGRQGVCLNIERYRDEDIIMYLNRLGFQTLQTPTNGNRTMIQNLFNYAISVKGGWFDSDGCKHDNEICKIFNNVDSLPDSPNSPNMTPDQITQVYNNIQTIFRTTSSPSLEYVARTRASPLEYWEGGQGVQFNFKTTTPEGFTNSSVKAYGNVDVDPETDHIEGIKGNCGWYLELEEQNLAHPVEGPVEIVRKKKNEEIADYFSRICNRNTFTGAGLANSVAHQYSELTDIDNYLDDRGAYNNLQLIGHEEVDDVITVGSPPPIYYKYDYYDFSDGIIIPDGAGIDNLLNTFNGEKGLSNINKYVKSNKNTSFCTSKIRKDESGVPVGVYCSYNLLGSPNVELINPLENLDLIKQTYVGHLDISPESSPSNYPIIGTASKLNIDKIGTQENIHVDSTKVKLKYPDYTGGSTHETAWEAMKNRSISWFDVGPNPTLHSSPIPQNVGAAGDAGDADEYDNDKIYKQMLVHNKSVDCPDNRVHIDLRNWSGADLPADCADGADGQKLVSGWRVKLNGGNPQYISASCLPQEQTGGSPTPPSGSSPLEVSKLCLPCPINMKFNNLNCVPVSSDYFSIPFMKGASSGEQRCPDGYKSVKDRIHSTTTSRKCTENSVTDDDASILYNNSRLRSGPGICPVSEKKNDIRLDINNNNSFSPDNTSTVPIYDPELYSLFKHGPSPPPGNRFASSANKERLRDITQKIITETCGTEIDKSGNGNTRDLCPKGQIRALVQISGAHDGDWVQACANIPNDRVTAGNDTAFRTLAMRNSQVCGETGPYMLPSGNRFYNETTTTPATHGFNDSSYTSSVINLSKSDWNGGQPSGGPAPITGTDGGGKLYTKDTGYLSHTKYHVNPAGWTFRALRDNTKCASCIWGKTYPLTDIAVWGTEMAYTNAEWKCPNSYPNGKIWSQRDEAFGGEYSTAGGECSNTYNVGDAVSFGTCGYSTGDTPTGTQPGSEDWDEIEIENIHFGTNHNTDNHYQICKLYENGDDWSWSESIFGEGGCEPPS